MYVVKPPMDAHYARAPRQYDWSTTLNAEAAPDPVALWLCQLPGMTVPLLRQLLGTFGSAAEIMRASSGALRAVGVAPGLVAKIVGGARVVPQVAAGLKGLQRLGIAPLPFASPVYPERLRELPEPPLVVYLQGLWPRAQRLAALVGPAEIASEVAEPWAALVRQVQPHVGFAALHGAAAAGGVPLGLLAVPFGLMLARQRLPQAVMRQVDDGTTTLLATAPPTAQPTSEAAAASETIVQQALLALSDALIVLPPFSPAAAPFLAAQSLGLPAFLFSVRHAEELPPRVRRLRPGKVGARALRSALGLNITGTQTVQQERLL